MELKYLNQAEFGVNVRPFLPYVQKLTDLIAVGEGILNIVFVNDVYIQALNKSYRGQDKATDVLSFNYETDGDPEGLMGEIYISVQTARRQAKDHQHSLQDELIKLLVHGLLHIHGYDHEKDKDYKKMYRIEKAVLGKIAGEFLLDV